MIECAETMNAEVNFPGIGHVHPGGEAQSGPQPLQGQVENSIDQDLTSRLAKGPSSLIDEQVLAGLNRLQDRNPSFTALQLIANPVAGIGVLSAFWGEAMAYASARKTVSQAVQKQVKWGELDIQRDMAIHYMDTLKGSLGHMLPQFCSDQGIDIPPANSIAEFQTLLKLNLAVVGVAKYEQLLQGQMDQLLLTRTRIEGRLANSEINSQLLPHLIKSQEQSFPLVETAIHQTVAHKSALVSGAIGATIFGAVVGFFRGAIVAINPEISWGQKKADQFKQGVKTRITSFRAR